MKLLLFLAACISVVLAGTRGASFLSGSVPLDGATLDTQPNPGVAAVAFNSTPETSPHRLGRRWSNPAPASDKDWDSMKRKGCNFVWLFPLTDKEAGATFNPPLESTASSWTEVQQFWDWGYVRKQIEFCMVGKNQYNVEDAFQHYGIGVGWDNWYCYQIEHGDRMLDAPNLDHQTYQNNGKTYRVTGAVYNMAMNHHDGALIITREYSPKNQAAVRNPPVPDDQLPMMSKASDIIFTEWAARAGSAEAAKNLKTVTIYRVSNEATTAAMQRALDSRQKSLSVFPGEQFDSASEEGKALIGSPNGQGVGFLLIQHKAQLGNLQISKIDVFGTIHDGSAWEAVLIFHIEAA